jgi:hypothetical protein
MAIMFIVFASGTVSWEKLDNIAKGGKHIEIKTFPGIYGS